VHGQAGGGEIAGAVLAGEIEQRRAVAGLYAQKIYARKIGAQEIDEIALVAIGGPDARKPTARAASAVRRPTANAVIAVSCARPGWSAMARAAFALVTRRRQNACSGARCDRLCPQQRRRTTAWLRARKACAVRSPSGSAG
jgi:hypothetical protein